jgi:hypothetical protein
MVYTLLITFLSLFVLFILMCLIEEYIIPKLSTDSMFKKWWRNHIIGNYTGPEDMW